MIFLHTETDILDSAYAVSEDSVALIEKTDLAVPYEELGDWKSFEFIEMLCGKQQWQLGYMVSET